MGYPVSFRTRWGHAVAESELPKNARLVAYALLVHMNPDGFCFPPYPLLKQASGFKSQTTIADLLDLLERHGFIRRETGYEGKANRYQGLIPEVKPVHSGLDYTRPLWTGHEVSREVNKDLLGNPDADDLPF